jgi:hypothetical protein
MVLQRTFRELEPPFEGKDGFLARLSFGCRSHSDLRRELNVLTDAGWTIRSISAGSCPISGGFAFELAVHFPGANALTVFDHLFALGYLTE